MGNGAIEVFADFASAPTIFFHFADTEDSSCHRISF